MPDRDTNQIDTTGSMLQEARKTSDMLSDTFTRPNMRDVAGDRITSSLDIQSPTERVFDRPNMRDVAGDRRMTAEEAAPQENILSDVSLKDLAVTSANVQRGAVEAPGINFDFLKGDRFKQGTAFTDAATRQAMTTDEAMRGTSMTKEPSATRAAKEADFASGSFSGKTVADSDLEADAGTKVRTDIKPKDSAVKTLKDSLTSLSQISPLRIAGQAIGGVLKAVS